MLYPKESGESYFLVVIMYVGYFVGTTISKNSRSLKEPFKFSKVSLIQNRDFVFKYNFLLYEY